MGHKGKAKKGSNTNESAKPAIASHTPKRKSPDRIHEGGFWEVVAWGGIEPPTQGFSRKISELVLTLSSLHWFEKPLQINDLHDFHVLRSLPALVEALQFLLSMC
jgi:hypothetical protein